MPLRAIDLRGARPPFDAALPRPAPPGTDVHDVVASILRQVRKEGDAAVVRCTAELDKVDVSDGLRVDRLSVDQASRAASIELRDALEVAWGRIMDYHAHEAPPPGDLAGGGVTVGHLTRAVERAGIYAPGGRARYPSTVLMCAAPARVAGVGSVALCVPPGPDGAIDGATLCAASVAGVDEVYRIGGAQAIAALAYGTASVPAVDVIAGPGNAYVAEAKRQVSGVVGVASAFAGPSEVVVVAGPGAPPRFAAIDLVVQAEHGPDGLAWLVSWDADLAGEIAVEVDRIVAASPRRADLESTLSRSGVCCLVDGPAQALAVANVVAPEHLQLMVGDDEGMEMLAGVHNAGCRLHRVLVSGQPGGLRCRPQPRAAHQPHGALRLRAAGGRLPKAPARHPRDAQRLADPRSARRHPGRNGGPPGARRLGTDSPRCPRRGGAPSSAVPPVRPDLDLTEGYHSPQVDAEVRLNTNESPVEPPPAWRMELASALEHVAFHRYPDRRASSCGAPWPTSTASLPEEVFCANGSNEVLQSLLLAFGGPGSACRWSSSRPTRCTRHIARITGTAVVEGAGATTSRLSRPAQRPCWRMRSRQVTFLCSPNNPTGRADRLRPSRAVAAAAPGLVVVDEAYGQFARPVGAGAAWSRAGPV